MVRFRSVWLSFLCRFFSWWAIWILLSHHKNGGGIWDFPRFDTGVMWAAGSPQVILAPIFRRLLVRRSFVTLAMGPARGGWWSSQQGMQTGCPVGDVQVAGRWAEGAFQKGAWSASICSAGFTSTVNSLAGVRPGWASALPV